MPFLGRAPNRARRQSGFPTFIPCQRQDAKVLPKRRQSHQGDKLCDVSTVPLVARWPVYFLARGSDADGEPHCCQYNRQVPCASQRIGPLCVDISILFCLLTYIGYLPLVVKEMTHREACVPRLARNLGVRAMSASLPREKKEKNNAPQDQELS